MPFKTEVASVYIFGQIESDDVTGGGGGLGRSARRSRFAVLLAIGALRRWATRHDAA